MKTRKDESRVDSQGIEAIFASYLPMIEEELRRVLVPPSPSLDPYYGMMRYHFGWVDTTFKAVASSRGKRLRPVLCLVVCEAAAGDPLAALPAAAAVEIVHNFSLAHDDIQDGDPMRSHRPALWTAWGVAQALNVGDGLLALAHLAMERLLAQGVSPARFLKATGVLDRACMALIQGQYLDVSFEGRNQVDQTGYLEMVAGKTAALLSCAAELGALLGSEDEGIVDRYRRFGLNLGFSFQMADDVLGIWGEPRVTGKPAASDILSKKKTLPVIYALQRSPALRHIYADLEISGESSAAVLEILDQVGARAYTERLAAEYRERALEELEMTGLDNEAQDRLRQLACFVSQRDR